MTGLGYKVNKFKSGLSMMYLGQYIDGALTGK